MSMRISILLSLFFAMQIGLGYSARSVKPYWEILPAVPTDAALEASSFGDRQFLYRSLVMDLQNFGDTGGRITPLKNYDMTQVVGWLQALDKLDIRANHHMALAMRYYSQTQDKPQLVHLIHWAQAHVAQDAERKQWWLSAAIMLASARLDDLSMALQIAQQLASYDFPTTRIEAFQYPAFILEQMGDFEGAAIVIDDLVGKYATRFPAAEIDWSKRYAIALREIGRRWAAVNGMGPLPP